MARPTVYKAEYDKQALLLTKLGATDQVLAEFFGVCVQSIAGWKVKYPTFLDALKTGKQFADDIVVASLYKRAKGFKHTEVIYERISDTGQKARHNGESRLRAREWEYAQVYFDSICCYCGAKAKMTKDHVVPLVAGGELCLENILPACGPCNSKKHDAKLATWYKRQKTYTAERYNKIMEYLEHVKSVDLRDEHALVVTKKIRKQMAPDTTACIFWLKNRRPDKWRDKTETEHSGTIVNITDDIK